MVSLGIPVGNKTLCPKKMPKWIIKASPMVKREFLNAFQGGDGGRMYIKLTNSSSSVQMNMTQQVTVVEHLQSATKFMEKMVEMYEEFEIKAAVKISDTEGGKKVVALEIKGSNENLNRYADTINYRYCSEKKLSSALPIEFLKYKLTRIKEREDAIEEMVLLDSTMSRKEIAEKVGVSQGMVNKHIADRKKGIVKKVNIPLGTINYPEFEQKFYMEEGVLCIAVESVKKIEVEKVYDFTTISDNHSFFANGLLVSNCSSESPEGEGFLSKNALVQMEDGSLLSIAEIVKGMGVRCMVFDKDLENGKFDTTYVDKTWSFKTDGIKRTLHRITLITGQEIEASDDHPFFTQHGWVETIHLNAASHKMTLVPWLENVSREVEQSIIMDSKSFTTNLTSLKTKNMIITKHCKKLEDILFPLYSNDHRTPMLARMFGYAMSNGSVTNSKGDKGTYLTVAFKSREDGINFIYNAEFLGFKANPDIFLPKSPGSHHEIIKYAGPLASLFLALGFDTAQLAGIPDWITQGSLTTKREFLAGWNSGTGKVITCLEDKIAFSPLMFKTNEVSGKRIEEIKRLYSDLGIIYEDIEVCLNGSIIIEAKDQENASYNYLTKIGYRYDADKSSKTLLIEKYLMAKEYKKFDLTYSQFVQLLEFPTQNESKDNSNILYAYFPIDKIERIADDICYDMTVENDSHNFIANGVITHNCGLVKNFAMTCSLSVDKDPDDFFIAMKGETEGYENKLPQHYNQPSKDLIWSDYVYILDSEDPTFKNIADVKDYSEIKAKTDQFADEFDEDYEIRLHLIREEKILEKFPYPIFFNGSPCGWCKGPEVEGFLQIYKMFGLVSTDSCIFFNSMRACLEIDTSGGRCIRPLLVVHENKLVIDEMKAWDLPIEELLTNGCVTFVDSREQEKIMLSEETKDVRDFNDKVEKLKERIAVRMDEVKNMEVKIDARQDSILIRLHTELKEMQDYPYTHCEIHPIAQYGNLAGMIPEANKTQGPRITYQASMGKQALNQYHTKHQERFDTTFKVMTGPTLPIFQSEIAATNGQDVMPAGDTIIKAYYAHPDNPEDGIVANEDTIHLAKKFRVDKYVTHKLMVKRGSGNKEAREENRKPPAAMFREGDTRFHALDEFGLPGVGLFLNKGDAIIGKIKITTIPGSKENKIENVSLYIGVGEEGYVDRVMVCNSGGATGGTIIKVKIRQSRDQIEGDKVASRYSQKGTFSRKCKREELPRVRFGPNKGLVADFYNNPHAVPSRMPIGELDEMLTSKASLYEDTRVDATTFNNLNMDYYRNILKREWDRYMDANPKQKKEYDLYLKNEILAKPWKNYQPESPSVIAEYEKYMDEALRIIHKKDYSDVKYNTFKNIDTFAEVDTALRKLWEKEYPKIKYDDFVSLDTANGNLKFLVDNWERNYSEIKYEKFLEITPLREQEINKVLRIIWKRDYPELKYETFTSINSAKHKYTDKELRKRWSQTDSEISYEEFINIDSNKEKHNYDIFLQTERAQNVASKTYDEFLALPKTQRLIEKYSFTNGYEIMEVPIREVPAGGVIGDGPKHLVPTGKYQPCRRHIFMGPCYTQVLRHQVLDKFQMRDEGTVAATTHQPIGGRARAGGQRFGEMERDALISHGATSILLERLMICSDVFTTVLCVNDCGHIPVSNVRKGEFFCGYCKMLGREGIPGKISLPYVFIYLIRLLQLSMISVTFDLVAVSSLGTGKGLLEDNYVS